MDDDDGGDDVYRCITGLVSDHLDRGAKVSPAHHVVLDHHDALDAHLRDQGLARFQVCFPIKSPCACPRAPTPSPQQRAVAHAPVRISPTPCPQERAAAHAHTSLAAWA